MAEQISQRSDGECPSALGVYTSMPGEETSALGTCEPNWAADDDAMSTAAGSPLEELASAIRAPRPDGAELYRMATQLEGRDLVRLRNDDTLWTPFLSAIGRDRASLIQERLAVLEDMVEDDDAVFFAKIALREELASDIRAALESALKSSAGKQGTYRVPSHAVRERDIRLSEETAGETGFWIRSVAVQMSQGEFSMSLVPHADGRVVVRTSGITRGTIEGHPLEPTFEEKWWVYDFFARFVGGFWVSGELGEVIWRS